MKLETQTEECHESAKTTRVAVSNLDGQNATKRQVVHFLGVVAVDAASGSLTANPSGLVTTGLGLIGTLVGGGALIDNREKDKTLLSGYAFRSALEVQRCQ
ncbi:MAG TPA: hypothetical protein VM223_26740 [Planctomycetota bacterium]|nr:hypothetical protein [Planctomycetota bacterium]